MDHNEITNSCLGQNEIKELTDQGIIPAHHDLDMNESKLSEEEADNASHPFLMGKVAAVVNEKKSAKAIVDELVAGASQRMSLGYRMIGQASKL